MTPPFRPLEDQVIVITGGSSGIGRATALRAAKAGAAVFLIARNKSALEAVAGEIGAMGGHAGYAVADVGVLAEVEAALERAIALFGRLDTVVHAAGVAVYSKLLPMPRDEHERLFQTNYWGTVNCVGTALRHLRHKGGTVICVGSVVSDIGAPMLGAYAASKHAVKGFIDSLRIELIAEKAPISLTLIKPSGVGTPLADHAVNHMEHAGKVPPPAYAPDSVAKAILHAAEHDVREVTVGGVGAFQILGQRLAPRAADRISSWIVPLLKDKSRNARQGGNLFGPGEDQGVRSVHEPLALPSLYAALAIDNRRTALLSLLLLGSLVAASRLAVRRAARRLN